MKALIPCTLGALAVGIATGWMLKGDGGSAGSAPADTKGTKTEERAASAGATAAAGESSGPGEHLKSQLRTPKEKSAEVLPAIADEHLEKMMANMKEQQTKRSEARIAALTEKLGLNASQQAKLRAYFEKSSPLASISRVEGGKGIKMESKSDNSAGSLDDVMKDLLTADQSEKYEEMKETERNQKVEARTLREMASLTQAVELRDDQRQAVYDILETQARKDVESGNSMGLGGLMAGAGPMLEFADFGGGGAVGSVAIGGAAVATNVDVTPLKVDGAPEGGNIDHAEVMKQMEQQRQTNIDNKVNSLAGVLDAAQQAKYRQSLEQGGPMIFGH